MLRTTPFSGQAVSAPASLAHLIHRYETGSILTELVFPILEQAALVTVENSRCRKRDAIPDGPFLNTRPSVGPVRGGVHRKQLGVGS